MTESDSDFDSDSVVSDSDFCIFNSGSDSES